ncbi:hypothetical protein GCM10028793_51820 [Nocardiopsis oceani]
MGAVAGDGEDLGRGERGTADGNGSNCYGHAPIRPCRKAWEKPGHDGSVWDIRHPRPVARDT